MLKSIIFQLFLTIKLLIRNKLLLPLIGIVCISLVIVTKHERFMLWYGGSYWISDAEIEGTLDLMFTTSGESSINNKLDSQSCACKRTVTKTNALGESMHISYEETMCFGGQSAPAIGHKFDCKLLEILGNLNVFEKSNIASEAKTDGKLIFVTAASRSSFLSLLRAISSVEMAQKARSHMVEHTIIVYDLGLDSEQIKQLTSICDVMYRTFQRMRYQNFLTDNWLAKKQWKPIIIAEMLSDYPSGFWWMDANVRWISNSTIDADTTIMYIRAAFGWLEPLCLAGIVLPEVTQFSVYANTNPGMYEYFPTHYAKSRRLPMYSTEVMYWLRTENALDVLKWWLLCSLTPECISPMNAENECRMRNDNYNNYAQCHEFDQSALNLILSSFFVHSDYGACASNRNDVSQRNRFVFRQKKGLNETSPISNKIC